MKQTIVVAGAGPGIGMGVARKFGREGFRVALVARNAERLNAAVGDLEREGIEVAAFIADLSKPEEIEAAFRDIKAAYGQIDVLEFSPQPSIDSSASMALDVTPASALAAFQLQVIGGMECVRQVLPGMRARGEGTIFVTTGYSVYRPNTFITPISMANAASQNYMRCLGEALKDSGIFVATVVIGVMVEEGHPETDPLRIAEVYYDLFEKRDRNEAIIRQGEKDAIGEIEKIVKAGK